MRTVLVTITLLVLTPILGPMVILAGLLGIRDRPGGIYEWAPRLWTRAILRAAGVRVTVHHPERMRRDAPCIYVSNHVSWFDVFTLATLLPRYKFVGKAELFRIPVFGAAARAAGMIPIERENRKAAFQSYEVAASRIQAGASVVVFPEGTRGESYALRPFKKGPFVLAAAAQVDMVPTIVHGTMHLQRKGSWRVRSGDVHVHLLEPIPTRGATYEDRDRLSSACHDAMAAALRDEYGIGSPAAAAGRGAKADPSSPPPIAVRRSPDRRAQHDRSP